MDTKDKLSPLTISLHWAVALVMIGMIAVGFYMASTEAWALYPIHKSIGVLIFFVVLVRIVWRIKNGWPITVGDAARVQLIAAKIVHWVLILGTLFMPLSGMLMSAAGGHGIEVFGLELIAMNPDPANQGEVLAHIPALASLGHEVHELLGLALVGAVVLHVIGALKHHILDKDITLTRMLGK